jgi:hypothetical protein
VNQQIKSEQDHEHKLLTLWAQLGAAMLERGLRYSRQDDPHVYGQASRLLAGGEGRFQLRVDFDPAGALTTRGLIVDKDGEPLVQVFSIASGPAA